MGHFTAALRKLGVQAVDFGAEEYKKVLEDAGFVDVTVKISVVSICILSHRYRLC